MRPVNEIEAGVTSLTPQERRCLEGVADHLQASEVAARLGLATVTVESHLAQARRKLGVTSSRAAVQLIRQAGCLHTGYGDGFSRIGIPASGVASVGSKGTADVKNDHGKSAAVEMGGPQIHSGGTRGTGASSRSDYTRHADDLDFRADNASPGTPEGNSGSRRIGAQPALYQLPLIPPRGIVPRVGLVLVAAFLLVVMLAVLASVHALLQ